MKLPKIGNKVGISVPITNASVRLEDCWSEIYFDARDRFHIRWGEDIRDCQYDFTLIVLNSVLC